MAADEISPSILTYKFRLLPTKRQRAELVKHQLITRLGGLMVVLAGLLFGALHYWPPHG
jgi:hypothetical protein